MQKPLLKYSLLFIVLHSGLACTSVAASETTADNLTTPYANLTSDGNPAVTLNQARELAKKAGECSDTRKCLRLSLRAMRLVEDHLQKFPNDLDALVALSKLLEFISDSYADLGHTDHSMKSLQKALDAANSAIKRQPESKRAIAQQAVIQANMMHKLSLHTKDGRSISDYRRALDLTQCLMLAEPDNFSLICQYSRIVYWATMASTDLPADQRTALIKDGIEKLNRSVTSGLNTPTAELKQNLLAYAEVRKDATNQDTKENLRKWFNIIDSYTAMLESEKKLTGRTRVEALVAMSAANLQKARMLQRQNKFMAARLDLNAVLEGTKKVQKIDPKNYLARQYRRIALRQQYLIGDKSQHFTIDPY